MQSINKKKKLYLIRCVKFPVLILESSTNYTKYISSNLSAEFLNDEYNFYKKSKSEYYEEHEKLAKVKITGVNICKGLIYLEGLQKDVNNMASVILWDEDDSLIFVDVSNLSKIQKGSFIF